MAAPSCPRRGGSRRGVAHTASGMRLWVDLANSPHVALFVPVIEALRLRGVEVVLSARDHAQTEELARQHWPDVRVIGGQSRGSVIGRATTSGSRVAALRRFAAETRPDVALSHAS